MPFKRPTLKLTNAEIKAIRNKAMASKGKPVEVEHEPGRYIICMACAATKPDDQFSVFRGNIKSVICMACKTKRDGL